MLISAAQYQHLSATFPHTHRSNLFNLVNRNGINNMSLNITSDGSPTPRRSNAGRFAMADDLTVDTSPEGLGAVGSRHAPQIPPSYLWPSSLTSYSQGVKRPLTTSTRDNLLPAYQTKTQTPTSDRPVGDGNKVRYPSTRPCFIY